MAVILEMKNITKKFPGVTALDHVNFSCERGEVHSLIGENGAGKSTLMKLLSGASFPTEGEILFDGKPLEAKNPSEALEKGIAIIYQELNLVTNLNAVENIFLGREIKHGSIIDFKAMKKKAKEILDGLDMEFNLDIPIKNLSVAQQQMIEIAKALSMNAKFIVMDEPTATLTNHEVKALFDTIRKLKQSGVTIVFISHHLSEIFEICDRITVLKDGQCMGTYPVEEMNEPQLIKLMVGRELGEIYPPALENTVISEKEVLRIENYKNQRLDDVSISLRKGEIVGLAGLVGAGRTELARAIFGADKLVSGKTYIHGKKVAIKSPREAIKNGVAFVTENRKEQGLVLGLSIKKNTSLPILKRLAKGGIINRKREVEIIDQYIKDLKIVTPSRAQKVLNLSGGNQQKVVLAKWLAADCDILILDEPTRGIDVGAKSEIYMLMRKLAAQGKAILMISSELPEILGMSDRILVMKDGKITGELNGIEASEERVLQFAMGEEK